MARMSFFSIPRAASAPSPGKDGNGGRPGTRCPASWPQTTNRQQAIAQSRRCMVACIPLSPYISEFREGIFQPGEPARQAAQSLGPGSAGVVWRPPPPRSPTGPGRWMGEALLPGGLLPASTPLAGWRDDAVPAQTGHDAAVVCVVVSRAEGEHRGLRVLAAEALHRLGQLRIRQPGRGESHQAKASFSAAIRSALEVLMFARPNAGFGLPNKAWQKRYDASPMRYAHVVSRLRKSNCDSLATIRMRTLAWRLRRPRDGRACAGRGRGCRTGDVRRASRALRDRLRARAARALPETAAPSQGRHDQPWRQRCIAGHPLAGRRCGRPCMERASLAVSLSFLFVTADGSRQ